MKKLNKGVALLLASVLAVGTLAGCGEDKTSTSTSTSATTSTETSKTETSTSKVEEPAVPWDGAYIEKEDYLAYKAHDLDIAYSSIEGQLGSSADAVKTAYENGIAAIGASNTVEEAMAAYDAAIAAIEEAVPSADGLFTYKKESNEERGNIMGLLERYAVNTGITGISLFEDGGYSMYNPRITLGTENYIVGYGFGILREGAITEDLEYETNPDWKRYYHTMEANDPGTLNYLNDQGAQVGDLYGYISASYITQAMNATKDGYDWVPELAKEKPQAVNDDDGDGMATKWRMEVRTGKDGLKYKTGSEREDRKAFDGREVALEDYEFAWKFLLTQANQLYRGSEQANKKSGNFVGVKEYYDGTEKGYNDDLWANVGIKTYTEDGKDYIEVEYLEEQTSFYAMYYFNSSLAMPVPKDFIDLVGAKYYLGFTEDSKITPVDNSLSLGAYYLERYDSDQQIVYKKNPYYVYADTNYSIPGVHVKIFTAANEDANATFNEFLAGHFDGAGIPQEFLSDYKNDPRTRSTTGTSNFKLNVNATDAETWEYLFGENGVVTQTPKDSYWNLKPALANDFFRRALSYSIDRKTFADARGSIPAVDYLSSNYMSDPENGISYSVTDAHKFAVENLLADTDGAGFSLELAREYFKVALTELEKQGAYTPGTKDAPTTINIEIAWMRPTQEEQYHNEIKNFMETAFNDDSVCGGVYKLSVDFWVGNDWSDVYYNKMMVGQFDIGFGSISGNSLDPLGFISVLSSDQEISGSFTLNWGTDTNDVNAYPLVYNGLKWSFDALYTAANQQAVVAKGQNKQALEFTYNEITKKDDGTYEGSFVVKAALADKTTFVPTDIECCNYDRYNNGDGTYVEKPVTFTTEDKGNGEWVVSFVVPADVVTEFTTGEGLPDEPTGATGFDIYYDMTLDGAASSTYYSVNDTFK